MPPRSPDITTMDFFFFLGFFKGKVYATIPQTIEELLKEVNYNVLKTQILINYEVNMDAYLLVSQIVMYQRKWK